MKSFEKCDLWTLYYNGINKLTNVYLHIILGMQFQDSLKQIIVISLYS